MDQKEYNHHLQKLTNDYIEVTRENEILKREETAYLNNLLDVASTINIVAVKTTDKWAQVILITELKRLQRMIDEYK